MSVVWYLRWKYFLLRKKTANSVRSPKTLVTVFMLYTAYSFIVGNQLAIILSFFGFLGFWIYVDYCRGVPNKWKRRQILRRSLNDNNGKAG
jgi:hypothetical protein